MSEKAKHFINEAFINSELMGMISAGVYDIMQEDDYFDGVPNIDCEIGFFEGKIQSITFNIEVMPTEEILDANLDYPVGAVVSVMFEASQKLDGVVDVFYSFQHGYDWLSDGQIEMIGKQVAKIFMGYFGAKAKGVEYEVFHL